MTSNCLVSILPKVDTMPRVNLTRQIKTDAGWKRAPLERDARGRIRWGNGEGRYLIEWREGGRRLRGAAGRTPAEALEAQRRKRLELEAKENNLELLGLPKEEDNILLDHALGSFLRDIKAFRNLCLANCYFSQDSSGFSVLLPFFLMRNLPVLFIHFIAVLARLLGPGGVRCIIA